MSSRHERSSRRSRNGGQRKHQRLSNVWRRISLGVELLQAAVQALEADPIDECHRARVQGVQEASEDHGNVSDRGELRENHVRLGQDVKRGMDDEADLFLLKIFYTLLLTLP